MRSAPLSTDARKGPTSPVAAMRACCRAAARASNWSAGSHRGLQAVPGGSCVHVRQPAALSANCRPKASLRSCCAPRRQSPSKWWGAGRCKAVQCSRCAPGRGRPQRAPGHTACPACRGAASPLPAGCCTGRGGQHGLVVIAIRGGASHVQTMQCSCCAHLLVLKA